MRITDPLCSTAETNTACEANILQFKKKRNLKCLWKHFQNEEEEMNGGKEWWVKECGSHKGSHKSREENRLDWAQNKKDPGSLWR